MSGSGVKCVTEPCTTACPDINVVIHPPPLCLTLPGVSLTMAPNQCLVESRTSCLTNGSDGCATRSSGVCAVSGGDTPCCTTTCPDSQLVIQPPPVCIKVPGAILSSHPNECIIKTSGPCVPSGSHPSDLVRSASVSESSLTSHHMSRSVSVPCGLNSEPPCVTQGASHKVIICPPPIEVTIPGPVLEVAAEECAVEVYNDCESANAITGVEQCAITSGEEGAVRALRARAQTCTAINGIIGSPSCVSQGPDLKIMIQPPPIEVELPGPVLKVFPESCKVETISPCTSQPLALAGCEPKALRGCETTNLASTNSSQFALKRPLPDVRRSARPWAEMYSRSVTPSHFSKYRSSFQSTC